MSRLKERYQSEIAPKLKAELGIANVHQVPRVEKVVINIGTGRAIHDAKTLDTMTATLRKVSGQQPMVTTAKHSIAGFKLRAGQKVGLKVTLRRERMYDFLDRLINVALPRVRDFHGLPVKALDRSGNYTIGLTDQAVFPELTFDDTAISHGLEVTIVTSGSNREHSLKLLELLGFPLERSQVHG